MNRVNSGIYPNSIEEVIYQPGQFGPVSTGWLDKVRSSGGYTDSARRRQTRCQEPIRWADACILTRAAMA